MEIITDVITVTAASAAKTAKIQFHKSKILIMVKGIYLWDYSITDMSALRASTSFVNPFLPICQPYGLWYFLAINLPICQPYGLLLYLAICSTDMSALRALVMFGNQPSTDMSALRALVFFGNQPSTDMSALRALVRYDNESSTNISVLRAM